MPNCTAVSTHVQATVVTFVLAPVLPLHPTCTPGPKQTGLGVAARYVLRSVPAGRIRQAMHDLPAVTGVLPKHVQGLAAMQG
jgi:hypothetical protein